MELIAAMKTMNDIEVLTKKFADTRAVLGDRVAALNEEIELSKRRHLRGIKGAVATAAAAQDELQAALIESRELFTKPKTQTFHGIRVGFQKGKGKIEFDDADQVVKLIYKHFPEQADVLVKKTEEPVKKALSSLSAGELKRLGITVHDAGEAVFIKPVDSEVDKMVDALLGSAVEEAAVAETEQA